MKSEGISACSIALKELVIGYRVSGKGQNAIFGPVNVGISHAEMVGIIGRNGIGKSTLLRTIAGLQPALKGQIFIQGIPIHNLSLKEMARMVSFVSTEPVYGFQIKVNELVAMGRHPHTGWFGRMDNTDRNAIQQAIELTGVGPLLSKSLHEISDGERQKVMIARALAQDTPVIILDEPTAFLDLPARYEILSILNDLTLNNNKTLIFSTHDLSIALEVTDKLWLLAENEIYQGAPEDLLISKVFRKLFLNSPAEFDLKSFSFRFKRDLKRQVEIRGDTKYRLLTRRAMERIGFRTVDNGTDVIVELYEKNGSPVWHLHHCGSDSTFDSIYALVSHLKISC